ncbi:hypothetical protein AGMMS49936_01760 [Endomicrobiia bacterium]|nr:hypothetical protein AGMMS49936_01760 [Endomicrobiia bacterium]
MKKEKVVSTIVSFGLALNLCPCFFEKRHKEALWGDEAERGVPREDRAALLAEQWEAQERREQWEALGEVQKELRALVRALVRAWDTLQIAENKLSALEPPDKEPMSEQEALERDQRVPGLRQEVLGVVQNMLQQAQRDLAAALARVQKRALQYNMLQQAQERVEEALEAVQKALAAQEGRKKLEEIQVAKRSARGVKIELEALLKRVQDYSAV